MTTPLHYSNFGERPMYQLTPSSFWTRIEVKDKESCWEWRHGINGHGYGQLNLDGKRIGAHRVAWILANSDIPDGLYVCHKCDNRSCCNPYHMFLGTHLENIEDRWTKERTGSRN